MPNLALLLGTYCRKKGFPCGEEAVHQWRYFATVYNFVETLLRDCQARNESCVGDLCWGRPCYTPCCQQNE